MHATLHLMQKYGFPAMGRRQLDTLQVNLGYRCNQSCLHCHVNASPQRTEMMSRETVADVLAFLEVSGVRQLDLTGGAPELNAHFRGLVMRAREIGVHVIDRCNLTVLEEPGQEGLAEFLAHQHVEVTASLPCYLEDNVDRQRGKGVFKRSIAALQRLNALGYGMDDARLVLNLVYNPQGAVLPPQQAGLETDYRSDLGRRFGIRFTHL
jgi:radical SAM/Cys-rich protein